MFNISLHSVCGSFRGVIPGGNSRLGLAGGADAYQGLPVWNLLLVSDMLPNGALHCFFIQINN